MKYMIEDITDICRACMSGAENSVHLIEECPAYAIKRLQIFGDHTIEIDKLRFDPRKILLFIETTSIKEKLLKWDGPDNRRRGRIDTVTNQQDD